MKSSLDVYVVYDKPRDYPDSIVVRIHASQNDGSIVINNECAIFKTIENARKWLEDRGLVHLSRDPNDDPAILEVWL